MTRAYRRRVAGAWIVIFFVPLAVLTLIVFLVHDRNAAIDECADRGLVAVQKIDGGHICVEEVRP